MLLVTKKKKKHIPINKCDIYTDKYRLYR